MAKRPDLGSLALFVRIAEMHSITRAARASHIALAAASRRIQQLEEQLGAQLLRRSARGVELTPAGTAVLARAHEMLSKVDEMRAEVSDYSKGAKGIVRIHANASALAQYLPGDLASFSAAHPEIKVALEEERSTAIVEAVRKGSADVASSWRAPMPRACSFSNTAPTCFARWCRAAIPCASERSPSRGCSTTTSWAWRATP